MALKNSEKIVGDFVKKRPVAFAFILFISIITLYKVLSIMEAVPEMERVEWQKGRVLENGDNLVWLGMEVAPISRSIRKEFDIPRKVNGVFVVNNGRGLAKKQGVKTGDIICSINRARVDSRRSFIKTVNNAKYYDGILLDIYRAKKRLYVSVPFMYEYGPIFGPNKRHWELGSPMVGKALPYGPLVDR